MSVCLHHMWTCVAQDVIKKDFTSVFALTGDNIFVSSDLGQAVLHNADSYCSVASRLSVEPKSVLFIDNEVRVSERAIERAGRVPCGARRCGRGSASF
jgi:hypothetical protein